MADSRNQATDKEENGAVPVFEAGQDADVEETQFSEDVDDMPDDIVPTATPGSGLKRNTSSRSSLSDRMKLIRSSSHSSASPTTPSGGGDDYMKNRWWNPPRTSKSDDQKGLEDIDESSVRNVDTEDGGSVPRVAEPESGLAPLKIPPPSDKLEYDIMDVVSPAEKVRLILSNETAPDSPVDEDIVVDLSSRSLFCQMDVLCHFDDGDPGWKESARWLKYEEKVESGDRWSKPHVPTASLHALFEIRKAMAENTCSVILDLEVSQGKGSGKEQTDAEARAAMESFVKSVTAVISEEKALTADQTKAMVEVLMRPHKHKHRKGIKKKNAGKHEGKKREANNNVPMVTEDDSLVDTTTTSKQPLHAKESPKKSLQRIFSRKEEDENEGSVYTYPGKARPDDLKSHKPNKKLMGKIPPGAEAVNILIGQVDFLQEPIMAFVRLQEPHLLADLTEVTVPSRFLLLCLGPQDSDSVWEYEEVGRAAAALFIDKVFCEVAYKARARSDLVNGIDEYMDDLTVLPPSLWDPSSRLEPPNQTMSVEKIKKRLIDSTRRDDADGAYHMQKTAGGDDTLSRTGRLFGGMLKDMKRRYPLYWSDIKDGFHPQCIASILFLYFACITPIVTFGGLLGSATEGQMGTMETMVSGAMCGLLYHFFSGQPLTIMGATGPMLIFESILYLVCKENQIDFLAFRFFTGIWVAVFLLIFVAFDLSALVKYITRFTEESFAILISLIFIFEAFKKVLSVFDTHPFHLFATAQNASYKCYCQHPGDNITHVTMTTEMPVAVSSDMNNTGYNIINIPVPSIANWTTMVSEDCITYQDRIVVDSGCISEKNCTDHHWSLDGPACGVDTVTHSVPDVFFLCCFLFLGTFVIAYTLRSFRTSLFFPTIVRSTVADFAVLIGIVTCTLTDLYLDLDTPKLKVPSEFATTVAGRGWVVNPFAIDYWWLVPLAFIPALLVTILIFLDQQITAVIVNRKEHKLLKSHGYHLDLMVLCVLIVLTSLFGLPWFVAATVRSITHVRSLIKQSELKVPGEKPQFLGVREQRLTGICIHILIGLSVFLTVILKHVPMAVLYGVFLYMGVTSLGGVQFVDRILILFMPQKYQPDHIYLRHVETNRVHVFTIIQMACMAAMWVVKSIKTIAIAFPVMIMALCFVRKAMDYYFTQRELFWLDHLLPEATRKEKEDKQSEMLDMAEVPLYNDNDDITDREKEVMLEGNWDKMIAKRDYGMGKKPRKRELSQGVIDRYDNPDEEKGTTDKLLGDKTD